MSPGGVLFSTPNTQRRFFVFTLRYLIILSIETSSRKVRLNALGSFWSEVQKVVSFCRKPSPNPQLCILLLIATSDPNGHSCTVPTELITVVRRPVVCFLVSAGSRCEVLRLLFQLLFFVWNRSLRAWLLFARPFARALLNSFSGNERKS